MPTPFTSSSASYVPPSPQTNIDALIAGVKWGSGVGTGAQLTYSFPWSFSSSAWFSGYNNGAYSSQMEYSAASHFSLGVMEQSAARAAMDAWASVANIRLTLASDTADSVGDIRIAYSSAIGANAPSGAASGWGSAYLPDAYLPRAGDAWLNPSLSSASFQDWGTGTYNDMMMMQVIGQALGLKHASDSPALPSALDETRQTVMSYVDSDLVFLNVTRSTLMATYTATHVEPSTPMVLDIAAIQYLYGPNTTYHTGDDTYTFDPAKPFLKTIWDAGGNDTISVSNFTLPCTIDLRPGSYSVISMESGDTSGYSWRETPPEPTYDGVPNLGIAFNCDIENATGGAGADTITGNALANRLDGGLGSDTLTGGAGDDTYIVNTSADRVVELANEGTDTIWSTVSMSLASLPNVENLRGSGARALRLEGNAADNVLSGTAGNDTLAGGAGTDTVIFGAARADYKFTTTASGVTASSLATSLVNEGSDTLTSIERYVFTDQSLALDLDGHAGMVARIVGAVLGPAALGNLNIVGTGLAMADAGSSESALVALAIDARLGAGASHQAVAGLLYGNVMGTHDAGVEGYLTGLLDSGAMTVPELGVLAANYAQNSLNIDLTGLAHTGLAYLPH